MNERVDTKLPERGPSTIRRFVRNVIDIAVFAALITGSAGVLAELASEEAPLTRLIPPFGVPLAALFTGALGILFGFVFLMNGRNLWPLVIGHGLYDAARFVYFHVLWTWRPAG